MSSATVPYSTTRRTISRWAASIRETAPTVAGRLFSPVDIAGLVYFRIAFGTIMLWEVWRYFAHDWIPRYFISPTFHFTYYGFEWIRPWPGPGMYIHFALLGLLALCITSGFCYRVASTLFFLGFSYVFLLEQARYLNHFYLVMLISFIMIFVPAHRAFSLDARFGWVRRSDSTRAWSLWWLRVQLGLVYFFGGVAKLNLDWLTGTPLNLWLAKHAEAPLIGPLFTQAWFIHVFAYGGLLFDLLVAPLLLWRRTRPYAAGVAVLFHLTNSQLFRIGIFPWFMIAATPLFFHPAWPRAFARWRWITPKRPAVPPVLGRRQAVVTALLCIYLVIQVLVPLRHVLYPGPVSWTEEGHRFSWRMKLRTKKAKAQFLAFDPVTGRTWALDARQHLTGWQERKMAARPDMILQMAHFLGEALRVEGQQDVEVRARVTARLNGRDAHTLINPSVNLVAEPRRLGSAHWIRHDLGPRPTS